MAGIPARIARILEVARRNGWKVVEDCAQAHGAWVGSRMVGTFGDAAAFSFYPTKNLGAAGDGGLVATADSNLYERLVSLRQYGWSRRYISETPGTNSRLDELQAALLSIRLKYLDDENTRRRSIAARYDQALPPGVSTARPYPEALPVHHLYIVETEQREALADHLRNCGVATARHYPCAIHHQPAYRNRLRGSTDLPMTEHLYQRHLSLPMHAYLEDAEVERVCEALNSWNP
jgi:dTDP-4-amino-4,6-dideoxygalactose transaminase